MNVTNIEAIVGVAGLILGATYLIGGLVVNLNLSRYGVTEYQVLRVKYLVVGLTYLTNYVAIVLLSIIPAFFLVAAGFFIQQTVLIISLLASLFLLWLWGRPPGHNRFSGLKGWRFWVIAGALSLVYPLSVAIRQVLAPQMSFESGLLLAQAGIAGILSFVGQTYFFARYLYGDANTIFGSMDPIGTGVPVKVRLAGKADELSVLKKASVPMVESDLTDNVLLLERI